MVHLNFRRRRSARPPSGRARERTHQLTRDAIEAEDIAVQWLRSHGFDDVHRFAADSPLGIRGTGVRGYVSFDPLPMKLDVLERIVSDAEGELAVSFAFAGWTPQAQAWADRHGVPLVRFTFAGTTDPTNDAARHLGTS